MNTTPSTLHHQKQHHQHNLINTSPSTQHHQHTPSTLHHQKQHHQHKKHQHTIYTTSSTLHHLYTLHDQKQNHQHNIINTPSRQHHPTPSTLHHLHAEHHPERSREEVRRRLITVDAGCVCVAEHLSLILCVAGAAPGAPPSHVAWQVQHCGAPPEAASAPEARQGLILRGTVGAPQSHFAWQVQHLEHLSLILRGRCSTRSTSREVRGSPATIGYCGRRLRLRGRRSTWSTSVSFCVAGAARGAPPERSAEF